jgi:hypothetical protein
MTFYDEWLELTERAKLEQAAARKVIDPHDLDWVTTRQRAALLIRGRGYAIVDDDRFEWEEGGAFHVSGPQTIHQYWATEEASLLRVHFGIRSKFFQPTARGHFPYLRFGAEDE